MSTKLRLTHRSWYGWTMWPGYGDHPYRSPIRVEDVFWYRDELLTLAFYNAGYAAGVQSMIKALIPFAHGTNYLLMREREGSERAIAIEPLDAQWLEQFMPEQHRQLVELTERKRLTFEHGLGQLAREW